MFELLGLSEQDAVVIGTGVGAFIGALLIAVRGAKKGRPTSAAVASAIQSANCRVPDLQPAIEALRAEQEEISDTLREMRRDANSTREMVVRIEERTRG